MRQVRRKSMIPRHNRRSAKWLRQCDGSQGRVGVNKWFASLVSAVLVTVTIGAVQAAQPTGSAATATDELEALKKEVLELNRDLFILEEDLLFPASTQIAVFVSLDVGQFFRPDAVKLSIDGKELNHHLYTERDLDALRRGGTHRLYVGNLTAGEHELVAVFTGYGPEKREFTRATSLRFLKETGAKFVELRINDDAAKQQADFTVREW